MESFLIKIKYLTCGNKMTVIMRLKTVKMFFISKGYVKLKYYENIGISVSGLTYIFHFGYL